MKASRECEDESHDVRANVIVKNFTEIGHHDRVIDKLPIVETGRRRNLWRLESAQALRLL